MTKDLSKGQQFNNIFTAIDNIKTGLTPIGRLISRAGNRFNFPLLDFSDNHVTGIYGENRRRLRGQIKRGENRITVDAPEDFAPGKGVLIYNILYGVFQFTTIAETRGKTLVLPEGLNEDFPLGSYIVSLKKIEYRFFPGERELKRRIDKGRFAPILEDVTDFYFHHFPDAKSIFYRVEVGKGETARGYMFLPFAVNEDDGERYNG